MFGSPRRGALVIQTGYMGDVILTTPLLTLLAARHGPVDVVATPASAPLLETHPAVREVVRYDKRGADRGWRGMRRLAADLRRRRHAAAYLPHRSRRSATLVFLARVPVRVGYADSAAASLYTERVVRPAHPLEPQRLAALAGLGAQEPAPPVSLGITDADRAEADAWLAAQGVTAPFVAFGPGSIWGAKRWPGFGALAARLELPVVLIGGPSDAAVGEQVAAAAPGRVRSACGAVGPRVSAALIARAAALVTNDSSPLHLALAVGTPLVALFGPTVASFGFGPLDRADEALGLEALLCRPCATFGPAVCPLGHHRCLAELGVDAVEAATRRALARGLARTAGAP